jgi:hypothetical protein
MPRITGNEEELAQFRAAVTADRRLGPSVKLLLLVLAQHYPVIEVTQALLARECGLATRTCRIHAATAEKRGWVTREVVYNRVQGSRAPTRYELVVQA